ncbi:Anoctamin-5 [Danaus plexippus plexippus]|uniref:Anoctamin n=1 Tax=Danaus plexippus plexippus TaxID=278856 RepID=A0A212F4Z3_DANPL|nr:Anoctamin-5 [Danaus plexippus plexippus]
MDSVRCEKYKVYQPELPSKKFPSDEDVSIHNIKVLRGDSGDQNKSTFFEGEIKRKSVPDLEVIEEDQEELGKKIAFGVFRDGVRRIDIVLVLKDDVKALINKIQLDFIVNILRVGLEVELEPGVSKRHKNLTFVKIHAPLHVLEKYGMYFGTKRNFADTRYEYIGRNEKNKERQCLKLMRDGFLNGYSNYERGIIVYKILLHLPFSNYEDDYGVERLLHKYIVADIYALHDGPTYLTAEKTIADINGKKILNDFWIGNLNIFQQQPIHLIHEYFGPTVAFYFSFYECFNKALQLAALASVADIIFGYFNLSSHEKPIEKVMCESRGQICQSCTNNVTCPARPAKEYCFPVKIHLILDHISDIPFWEKEYMLRSISYEDMFMKYMGFASQFAMVLWFVIAFPLAPLVIYLINIIDIKLQARKFLQISRRPLFLKTPVIGWSKGLFHGVIAQSGVSLSPWALASSPRERAFHLGRELGIDTNNTAELLG